ncbi:DUF1116 domain-containing protein [Marinobacter salinexigens]|uniref:DUF1116 domain-containing protein n=1 Tax=Marinobacter salinexigens TaxID=2919747 RepID=A0A5B0VEP7_9GAMM|nr:DUF1116 domain-containing protein [Marinobacter salinexigens]KAA1172878.1 DUF1116 domain-containing protein [Marinobacter salinexigens]
MNRDSASSVDQTRAMTANALVWDVVAPARDAVGLEERMLLHAGPPFIDATVPSNPVLSSAVICALYEGWAEDEVEAERMIRAGEIRLEPSLGYRVSVPLAGVVSPSTALVGVTDPATGKRFWSLLHSGPGAEVRFGSRNPDLFERMEYRDCRLAAAFQAILSERPISLLPIAAQALDAGDDLHCETTVATRLLATRIASPEQEIALYLDATPLFFLTLWMACALHLADRLRFVASDPDVVLAIAGNGERVGVRCVAEPDTWVCGPGMPPAGELADPEVNVAKALGDSGVIDALGFGGQIWQHSHIGQVLPGWIAARLAQVEEYSTASFGLGRRIHTGFRLQPMMAEAAVMNVSLAMVDGRGETGLLGRGLLSLQMGQLQRPLS